MKSRHVLLPITDETLVLPHCQKCKYMRGSINPQCTSPENPIIYIDLILGIKMARFHYCGDARESEEACGLTGKWFKKPEGTSKDFTSNTLAAKLKKTVSLDDI